MTSTLPPPPRAEDRTDVESPELWRIAPSAAVLVSLLVGGLAVDLGMRHPAGALSVVAVAVAGLAGRRGGWVRGPLARRLLGLSLLPASMLMLRDASWLTVLDLGAAVGLIVLAVAVRGEPRSIGRALGRLVHPVGALEPATMSVRLVADSARATLTGRDVLGRRILRLTRGLSIAVPVTVVLAALLSAADAVFRSWLEVPFDATMILDHAVVVMVGAAATAMLAGHGAWARPRPAPAPRRFVGPTEASVVLAGVVAVYGVFVASQIIAIAAGGGYVERTTGLTYAEYARAGFFQLVAAAILTLVVLVMLRRHRRAASPRLARRLVVLELSTVGLTLVVVGVAIRRLFLYEAEYGLTVLRFSTIVFALFIGFVFIVTGLSIVGRLRHDAAAVVMIGALATLLAVNVANPERIIAERNIARFGGTDQLDIDYLVDHLGADALPTMLADPAVAARVCGRHVDDRLIVFNWSRVRAAAALADACG
ncbi:MAG: DUF4173 domain-containing protein [Acidimicrobiales bacterium]